MRTFAHINTLLALHSYPPQDTQQRLDTVDEHDELMNILLEYVLRYGLTDSARKYFLSQSPITGSHFPDEKRNPYAP